MKVFKAILKTIIILAILGGAGYWGYTYYTNKQAQEAAAATTAYTQVTIGTGSLTKSVTGTGSLTISQTEDVSVDFPVVIAKTLVREGESVKAGDPIAEIDADQLKAAIITMNQEIATLDSSIASLTAAYDETSYIKPSVAGRVKQTFAQAGDMTSTVVAQYGGLMVLSTDGKMKVTVDAGSLTVDQAVTVVDDTRSQAGTVEAVSDGQAIITFTDAYTLPDAEVQVLVDGAQVAEGVAKINMPYIVSTTTDGYISKAYYGVNIQVTKKTRLYYVTNIPADTDYDTYMTQREDKVAAVAAAREVLVSGQILSTVDGIVSAIEPASSSELTAGYALATVYVGDAKQMIISVDELDIINVAVGQAVSIAMDAVEDKTYDATVSYISQIGTSSSGVTSYNVTLDVTGDDQLKIGMNGTATIVVEQVDNVVLVPLTAVSTGRKGSYVWLYSGTDSTDSANPGVQTFIETGLSNDSYAEVTSGLSAGDVVLITRTASSGSSSTTTNSFSMGGFDMGSMPSGGDMPSGNFGGGNSGGSGTRPSGTGTGGGSKGNNAQ